MKVKCIKNGCIFTDLGEVFEVEKETVYGYVVNTNFGKLLVWKFDFEIVKEDKMENRIVRKLEDLDGLENGMGLKIEIKKDTEKGYIVAVVMGNSRTIYEGSRINTGDNLLKAMGFKFDYKPTRTINEVIQEMKGVGKLTQQECGGITYEVFHITDENFYSIHNAKHPSIGTLWFDKETAKKYADELNEIINNK